MPTPPRSLTCWGQPRHDDPATANTGIGYPIYVQSSPGASTLPATSTMTALNPGTTGGVVTYTLPFAFSFYGTAYTKVIVSSQGYLQFAGPNSSGYDTPSQAGLLANVRIAPFWAPFYSYQTGNGTFVSSTATSVTFEWVGFNPAAGGGAVNFAVTLNSNGSFSFDYGAGNANLNPVIGVSAGNGIVYVLSSANGAASLANAPAQTFTPTVGDTYFDIGAFEFQGSSADKTPPHRGRHQQPAGE